MERVVIEVGGDTKALDTTIKKLTEIKEIDQASADQFRRNNKEAEIAAEKRNFLLSREENHLQDLKEAKSKAFDPSEIQSFAAAIKNSEERMLLLKSATNEMNSGIGSAITGIKGMYSVLRQAAYILPGIGVSGIILAGWNALSGILSDFVGDLFDAKEQIEEFNKENKITNDNMKETGRLRDEQYKLLIKFKVLYGELTKAQGDQLLIENDYENKRKKRQEDYLADLEKERDIHKLTIHDLDDKGKAFESKKEKFIESTGEEITIETMDKKDKENAVDYNKKALELRKGLQSDLKIINDSESLEKVNKLKTDEPKSDKPKSDKIKKVKSDWDLAQEEADRLSKIKLAKDLKDQKEINEKMDKAQKEHDEVEKTATGNATVWYDQDKGITLEDHNATVTSMEALRKDQDKKDKEKKDQQKKDLEDYKKHVKEINELTQTITDAVEESINTQMKANQTRIDQAQSNIDIQKTLAEKGLANDLAFEEKRQNTLAQAQVKEQLKLKKVKELEIFLNALAKFAESDPGLALAKSLELLANAKGGEAAFGEKGGIAGEFQDRKMIGGFAINGLLMGRSHSEGGILTELERGEGVLSRKEIGNIGGKEGFYQFKNMLKQPLKEKLIPNHNWNVMVNQDQVVAEIKELKAVVSNLKQTEINWDGQQQMILTEIKNGIKTITKHSKPRI